MDENSKLAPEAVIEVPEDLGTLPLEERVAMMEAALKELVQLVIILWTQAGGSVSPIG